MKKIILIFTVILTCSFYTINKPEYYGEFRAIKMMNYYDTTLSSIMYQGISFLYNVPTPDFSPVNGVDNGIVKFNNRPLYYEPSIRAYLDSADRKSDKGINWSLSGSNFLPNFTFSSSHGFPQFSGINFIPSIINKSDNLVVPFNNIQGVDEIEFTIDDLQLHALCPWYRKVNGSTNTLIIPKTHLCDLQGEIVTIRISFIRKEEKKINGKTFKFEHRLNINKLVSLIN